MKKVILSTLAAATLLAGYTAAPVKAEAGVDTVKVNLKAVSTFKDVKGHWAENVIARALELKLITGYEDGTFKPNGQITRSEFASILSRATKLTASAGENPFTDMKGHWAEAAVTQLTAQGFIKPGDYPNGFKPNSQLTRYEMMKWIANGLIASNETFKQAFEDTQNTLIPAPEAIRGEISAEKIPYIALVRGTGIAGGFEDGTIKLQNTTTRAEVAAILLRYMDVEGKSADAYRDLNELREVGTTGTNVITLAGYKYNQGSFADIVNTPITLSNKSARLKVKHYIVVDARAGNLKGVYSSLFYPKIENYQKGQFIAYAELDFTSLIDKPSVLTYSQGLKTLLITFYRIADKNYVDSVGIETFPQSTANYFKKNETKSLWTTGYLDTKGGYSIRNDNGEIVSFQKD